jgi:hypothetical protein
VFAEDIDDAEVYHNFFEAVPGQIVQLLYKLPLQ